jgi:hypothetical protein
MSRQASSVRITVAVSLAALVIGAGTMTAASAAANAPVGPHQYFSATVNGSSGDAGRVAIWMACYGPIQPGQTGHPVRGQTVGVKLVPVPSSDTSPLGYTGNRATSIGAFFGAPPPATPSGGSYVRFTSYGTKAIPTSLVLPCSGTGQVTSVPLPLDPSAHSIAVPVSFVGQP